MIMSKFKKGSLAEEIWNKKYRYNNESWDEFVERIYGQFKINYVDGLKYPIEEINSSMKEYINTLTIVPGGSVLSSVGTPQNCSLSNCFVVEPPCDSMESIFNTARDISQIYKRRGGAGLDISKLRPNGAKVNNSAKTTSGPVSFMDLYSHVTNITGQNARRGALMISIDINHPDSPEFIESKQDLTRITGANISVKISSEFIKAADNKQDYILRWPLDLDLTYFDSDKYEYNKLYQFGYGYIRKVKANELWDKVIHCAWNTAEPGVLMWDNIMENDPASYYSQFRAVSTNPCGEIPLGPYDSCRLIAVNLYKFVKNPYTNQAEIDIDELYKAFYIAQIMGDRLVDLELEKIDNLRNITAGSEKELWDNVYRVGEYGRRTGIGFTGYADMLAAMGVNYGDDYVTELVMSTMYTAELDATIDLAKIHGDFPCYNHSVEFKEDNKYTKFIETNFPEQYQAMKTYGRRNISWSTVAPTGSISILTQTSSGIEPQFSLFYKRRVKCIDGEKGDYTDLNGVQFKTHFVIAQAFIDWMEVKGYDTNNLTEERLNQLYTESPWYKNCAGDIDPMVRVATQAHIQRYITHSISSTCNLPETVTEEEVSKIYHTAAKSLCKGITIYRDNCRAGILIKEEKPKEKPIIKEEPVLKYNYIVPVSRKQMGITSGSTFCKKCACGTLYITCNRDDQGNLVEVFTHTSKGGICQANLNAETRMISLALRSGVKVDEIVDQLKGITCPACTIAKAKKNEVDGISCADIISRTITEFQNRPVCPYEEEPIVTKEKKIISEDKKYEECPECHSKSLIREGGCKQCLSCGYSACS